MLNLAAIMLLMFCEFLVFVLWALCILAILPFFVIKHLFENLLHRLRGR